MEVEIMKRLLEKHFRGYMAILYFMIVLALLFPDLSKGWRENLHSASDIVFILFAGFSMADFMREGRELNDPYKSCRYKVISDRHLFGLNLQQNIPYEILMDGNMAHVRPVHEPYCVDPKCAGQSCQSRYSHE
jgi:hypothetical protein